MKRRTIIVLLALGSVVAVPIALLLTIVVSIHIADRTNGTLVSSGEERQYLLFVPHSYDRTRPTPLVISMHGAALWPAKQMAMTHWNALAERDGFIVVYPSGSDVPKIWHLEDGAALTKDIRFIASLIDRLETKYNIDETRIYADGYSAGGGMAFVLSCTLSDRIAAVGMVAAAQLLPWPWCKDHRAVPMIAFHGTADPMVPYDGGFASSRFAPTKFAPVEPRFPSVRRWASAWAARNRCQTSGTQTIVAANVRKLEYAGCADDAAVVLYSLSGGGHTWPGGAPLPEWMVGKTNHEIDATAVTWRFFREHPAHQKSTEGLPHSINSASPAAAEAITNRSKP